MHERNCFIPVLFVCVVVSWWGGSHLFRPYEAPGLLIPDFLYLFPDISHVKDYDTYMISNHFVLFEPSWDAWYPGGAGGNFFVPAKPQVC